MTDFEESSDEESDQVALRITFSLDRDNFFRRACPECGRDFKTEVSEADLASTLEPVIQRLGLDIGEQPDDVKAASQEELTCPYCEHRALASEMLTSEFLDYAKRFITREVVTPMMERAFSDIGDSFGSHGHSGGLFSIQFRWEYHRGMLPPRPISGPDQPDMTIIELLCCGKRVKVADGWYGVDVCPYCTTRVALRA